MKSDKLTSKIERMVNNDPTFTEFEVNTKREPTQKERFEIINALRTNTTLMVLDLSFCDFFQSDGIALAKSLKYNNTLTKLSLFENRILNYGAFAFAELLKVNTSLTNLNLYNNSITEIGAVSIAYALNVNKTLKYLDFGMNRSGYDGGKAFSNLLQTNKTLTSIDLSANEIAVDSLILIAESLKLNKSLTHLDLTNNYWIYSAPKDSFLDAIYNYNGMLLSFPALDGDPIVTKALQRNKNAHKRVVDDIMTLLAIGKFRMKKETIFTEEDFSAIIQQIPNELYRKIASDLWETRGDPSWWTRQEHPEKGNYGETAEPIAKKIGDTQMCRHCNISESLYMEKNQPEYRFCSVLCQWMVRIGSWHGLSLSNYKNI